MDTEARARSADAGSAAASDSGFAPGASVVLRRPMALRGTIGTVQRLLPSGWEVEIRTAVGGPMHLTVPERSLHLC